MTIFSLRLVRLLIFVLLIPVTVCAQASDLDRIPALIKGGALGLAQSMVERNQPSPRQTELWMTWERQRYAVYFARGDWDRIANPRVAKDAQPGLEVAVLGQCQSVHVHQRGVGWR